MPDAAEMDDQIETVIRQLEAGIGQTPGGPELVAAVGELLRISLRHDRQISDLDARLRRIEQLLSR